MPTLAPEKIDLVRSRINQKYGSDVNASRDLWAAFRSKALQKGYDDPGDFTPAQPFLGDFGVGVTRGAAGTVGSASEMLGREIGSPTLQEFGQSIKRRLPAPREGATSKIGEVVGSAGVTLPITAAAVAYPPLAIPSLILGGAVEGAATGQQTYEDAINAGASPEDAAKYARIVGAGTGTIGTLPIGIEARLLKMGTGKLAKSVAGRIGVSALSEGAEEGAQGALQEGVAKTTYDPNRPYGDILKSVGEQALTGAAGGALLGLPIELAMSGGRRVSESDRQAALEAVQERPSIPLLPYETPSGRAERIADMQRNMAENPQFREPIITPDRNANIPLLPERATPERVMEAYPRLGMEYPAVSSGIEMPERGIDYELQRRARLAEQPEAPFGFTSPQPTVFAEPTIPSMPSTLPSRPPPPVFGVPMETPEGYLSPIEQRAAQLPKRTLDTMSSAISMSSPSGKVSKRATKVAQEKLRRELFGEGMPEPSVEQPTEATRLRREAKQLRDLAQQGMKPRAYLKKAQELEMRANELEPEQQQTSPIVKPSESTPTVTNEQLLESIGQLPTYEQTLSKVSQATTPEAVNEAIGNISHLSPDKQTAIKNFADRKVGSFTMQETGLRTEPTISSPAIVSKEKKGQEAPKEEISDVTTTEEITPMQRALDRVKSEEPYTYQGRESYEDAAIRIRKIAQEEGVDGDELVSKTLWTAKGVVPEGGLKPIVKQHRTTTVKKKSEETHILSGVKDNGFSDDISSKLSKTFKSNDVSGAQKSAMKAAWETGKIQYVGAGSKGYVVSTIKPTSSTYLKVYRVGHKVVSERYDLNVGQPSMRGLEAAAIKASSTRIISDEAKAKAEETIKRKMSNLSANPIADPELWKAATTLAAYHIENGVRSTVELGKRLQQELKSRYAEIDPHLNELYEEAKALLKPKPYANAGKVPDYMQGSGKRIYQMTHAKESNPLARFLNGEVSWSDIKNRIKFQFSDRMQGIYSAVLGMSGDVRAADAAVRKSVMSGGQLDNALLAGSTPRFYDGSEAKGVKSLEDILKPFTTQEQYDKFWVYSEARIINDTVEAMPDYKFSDVDYEDYAIKQDAKQFVEENKDNSEFKTAYDELQKLYDYALKYAENVGMLSAEQVSRIKSKRASYIPLYHALAEEDSGVRTVGANIKRTKAPVGRLGKGGVVYRMHPAQGTIIHLQRMIQKANDFAAIKQMMESWKSAPEEIRSQFITEKGAQSKQLSEANLARILGQHGFNSEQVSEWVKTHGLPDVWQRSFSVNANRGEFEFDGKVYKIEDPLLLDTMRSFDPATLPTVFRIMESAARLLRLTATGVNLSFNALNFFRDAQAKLIMSELDYRKNPDQAIPLMGHLWRAMNAMRPDAKFKQDLQKLRSAGGLSGRSEFIYGGEGKSSPAYEMYSNISAKDWKYYGKPQHWLKFLEHISAQVEEAPRIAEGIKVYRQAINDGKTEDTALSMGAKAARETTLSFERGGKFNKDTGRLYAFFNPAMLGLEQTAKLFKLNSKDNIKNAGKYWLRGVLAFTLPSLILQAINEEKEWYKQLPQWQKDVFWHFNLGNNKDPTVFRIPKAHAFGLIFSSIPERVADYARTKDESAFRGLARTATGLLPTQSLLPTAVNPIAETMANRNFFLDRAIVPPNLEKAEPRYQSRETTGEFARTVGNVLNISPAKIENFVRGYTSVFGAEAMKLMDAAFREFKDKPDTKQYRRTASDLMIVGRLFSRQETMESSEDVDWLYETHGRLQGNKNAGKLAVSEKSDYLVLNNAENKLNKIRKQRKILREKLMETEKDSERVNLFTKIGALDKAAINLATRTREAYRKRKGE